MKRIGVLAGLLIVAFGVLGLARPAGAHPLGNFSVNQLEELALHPDRVDVAVTVDLAELPTLQEQPAVEKDGPTAYAISACTGVTRDFAVTAGGHRLAWTVSASAYGTTAGAAGLSTSRLTCSLTAPASLSGPSTVDIDNRYRADRVGWRELTATPHDVHVVGPGLPARSVSGGLSAYPRDLLSSPLDVRSAHLRVEPGAGPSSVDTAAPVRTGSSWLAGGAWLAGAEQTLRAWVGARRVTPVVGLLAVLLALVLGAAHAALPGHGKTVMAAYLAGRHGRPRDALAVGATVTLTHTGGVLVLGLLLTTVAGLAGERILGWLGVASGALIAALGAVMLLNRRRSASGQPHPHDHAPHSHGRFGHAHTHDHALHTHAPHTRREMDIGRASSSLIDGDRPSRLSIVSMGVAGGLVPSPSALVILLGAIGLGRTGFGVLLVVGYGLGMAATLTAAGLLLIRLQDRWSKRLPRLTARLSVFAPTGTAALVLLVGLGLAGRALAAL